ncbi:MAG: toll/interleukin-1 receptor domain-containing protein [Chloroflexota bacterium]
MPEKKHHFFISYSRTDAKIVNNLLNDIQVTGIKAWVGHSELQIGTLDWENSIRDAVLSSMGLIYCATPDARTSPYVRGELQFAYDNNVPILPVWLKGEKYSDCFPIGYTCIQNIDLRKENYEEQLPYLISQLIELIYNNIDTQLRDEEIFVWKGNLEFALETIKIRYQSQSTISGELFSSEFIDNFLKVRPLVIDNYQNRTIALLKYLQEFQIIELDEVMKIISLKERTLSTIKLTKLGETILEHRNRI